MMYHFPVCHMCDASLYLYEVCLVFLLYIIGLVCLGILYPII